VLHHGDISDTVDQQIQNVKKKKELHLDMGKGERKLLSVLHEMRRLKLEAELLEELAVFEKLQLVENDENNGDQNNRRGDSSLFSLFSTDTTAPAVRSLKDGRQIEVSTPIPSENIVSTPSDFTLNENEEEPKVASPEQDINYESLKAFIYDMDDEDEVADWLAKADQKFIAVNGENIDISHSKRLQHPDFQGIEESEISFLPSNEVSQDYVSIPSDSLSELQQRDHIKVNSSALRTIEKIAINKSLNVTVQKESYLPNGQKIFSVFSKNDNHHNSTGFLNETKQVFSKVKGKKNEALFLQNRLASSAIHEDNPKDSFLTQKDFETSHWYNILDLGCGSGNIGMTFNSMADHIIGVDLSLNSIEGQFDNRLLELGKEYSSASDTLYSTKMHQSPYTSFILGDIEDVVRTMPDESQDIVIASDSLRLMGDLELLFSNVKRLLRPQILRNSYPDTRSLETGGGLFICDLLFFTEDPEIESEFMEIRSSSNIFSENGNKNMEEDTDRKHGKRSLDYILHRDLYYVHSPSYVVNMAKENGLQLIDFSVEHASAPSFPTSPNENDFLAGRALRETKTSNSGKGATFTSEKEPITEASASSYSTDSSLSKVILIFEKL